MTQNISNGNGAVWKPNFKRWSDAGFTEWLLPIGPLNAKLSPYSKIDPSRVGKIPMAYDKKAGGWLGYSSWPKKRHTVDHLKMFQRWGAGVGLNTEIYNAGDIDVEDKMVAAAIEQLMIEHLGPAPVRYRDGSPRRLLMYKVAEGISLRKRRLAWRDSVGPIHAIDWLATGQQFVCEAIHKSGAPYKWRRRQKNVRRSAE